MKNENCLNVNPHVPLPGPKSLVFSDPQIRCWQWQAQHLQNGFRIIHWSLTFTVFGDPSAVKWAWKEKNIYRKSNLSPRSAPRLSLKHSCPWLCAGNPLGLINNKLCSPRPWLNMPPLFACPSVTPSSSFPNITAHSDGDIRALEEGPLRRGFKWKVSRLWR